MKKNIFIKILILIFIISIIGIGVFVNFKKPQESTTNNNKNTFGNITSSGNTKIFTKNEIIPEIKNGDFVLKDIEVVKVTNGILSQETKFIKKKEKESLDDFIKRIGKKNTCYLNQYISYHYNVINGRGGRVYFDKKYVFDYDKDGKIIQVSTISFKDITQKEFFKKNPSYKEEISRRKEMINKIQNEEEKKRMLQELEKELNNIPKKIVEETKLNVDLSKFTFKQIMDKFELPENCKEKVTQETFSNEIDNGEKSINQEIRGS